MPTGSPASQLVPVDSLEVLVLVDNVTDALSTVPPGVANETAALLAAGMTRMSGTAKCCACHGLSLVLAATVNGEKRHMLFDAGPESYAVKRNGERLGIPFAKIEAVALSQSACHRALRPGSMKAKLCLISRRFLRSRPR